MGDLGQRELRRQHLALLGHLHPAGDRARRLRVDRAVGRPAAAAQRAAAAVEEHPPHAVLARAPRRARSAPGRSPSRRRRSPRPCWSPSSRSSPPARRRRRAARSGTPAAPAAAASSSPPAPGTPRPRTAARSAAALPRRRPREPALLHQQQHLEQMRRLLGAGHHVGLDRARVAPAQQLAEHPERPDDLLRGGREARSGPTGSAAAAPRSRARAARRARLGPSDAYASCTPSADSTSAIASPWRAACSRTSSRAKWKPNTSTWRIVSWSWVAATNSPWPPRSSRCASRRSASSSAGAA